MWTWRGRSPQSSAPGAMFRSRTSSWDAGGVWLFAERRVDVAVLEVGLGGRLDAVNAFDADCAVVTSVDIDHVDYLGADRESRSAARRPAYSAPAGRRCVPTPAPPASLTQHAAEIGAAAAADRTRLRRHVPGPASGSTGGRRGRRSALPHPALRGACQLRNAAAASPRWNACASACRSP